MHFEIVTLFPRFFETPLTETILGRAATAGVVTYGTTDLRQWGMGRHKSVDDTPYGGGAGMVMRPEPVVSAIRDVRARFPGITVALLSPDGEKLSQPVAHELATLPALALVCGRYEGFDARIFPYADRVLSLGDFVLSGGEPAALAIIDAVTRLIPGALGNAASSVGESFSTAGVLAEGIGTADVSLDAVGKRLALLEHPHYTRPPVFEGAAVPEILVTGHHAKVAQWRHEQALRRTWQRRPDLLADHVAQATLTAKDRALLERFADESRGPVQPDTTETARPSPHDNNRGDGTVQGNDHVDEQDDR
jgi:tRNA (guanine37-N1)-methyltransferase